MKALRSHIVMILMLAAPALGAQFVTVNGKTIDSVTLRVGQSCVVGLVSDDANSYQAYIGFDDQQVLGSFVHVETLPEAGDLASVAEYNVPSFYGYFVVAAGTDPPPSPGVHFVFSYTARQAGSTDLKLYDDQMGQVLDSVHIEVVRADLGTAFTYQGRLLDSNVPADGLYDFWFGLYDCPSDGNLVGGPIEAQNVEIIDGYFTITLDFGNVFDNNGLWMGIGVKDSNTGGEEAFVMLEPRQKVMPVPAAGYARLAEYAVSAANGVTGGGTTGYICKFDGPNTIGSSVIYESSGNIGVGGLPPEDCKFWVAGNIRACRTPEYSASLVDGSGVYGHYFNDAGPATATGKLGTAMPAVAGVYGSFSGSGTGWAGYFEGSAYFSGSVGVGTTDPMERFDVAGGIRTNYIRSRDDTGLALKSSSGTTRVIVKENGNVGIGTTSPSGTFHVDGGIAYSSGADGTDITLKAQDGADNANPFGYGGDGGNIILMPGDGGYGYMGFGKRGKVGIWTTNPEYTLDVDGSVQALAYYTGDIFFQKDGEKLWRMFEDKDGLYVENLTNGRIYTFVLREKDNKDNSRKYRDLEQRIKALENENNVLKHRLKALEQKISSVVAAEAKLRE